ncbi:GNAT family N-acetyltransferase [Aureisphaera galaxeae]|uniref:GNAT family N-acetyltransferase n=1 Tax=Aureisphaera galaxeae TaxID=1538023 RepID=UPI002350D882|nr:GNAT family N-acetyltransferase [Aureisphaera galaxeae]MDC8006059.1 GNAT family N-acetyltransferase [Aureisphaera galaxeae]
MAIDFRIIPSDKIMDILPLVYKLNEGRITKEVLTERILEMAQQRYECLGIYDGDALIGVCGMWFQTRHYAGRSCEVDHVIIDDTYRGQGIGDKMMQFVYEHAKKKGCRWVELNTYVHNFPSHKFYYNQGFVAKGYHFIKDITK